MVCSQIPSIDKIMKNGVVFLAIYNFLQISKLSFKFSNRIANLDSTVGEKSNFLKKWVQQLRGEKILLSPKIGKKMFLSGYEWNRTKKWNFENSVSALHDSSTAKEVYIHLLIWSVC